MMPFLIHSLGNRLYGIWLLVGSLLGYYGLMDFGLTSAVQRFVSASISSKKYDDVNRTFNTILCIFIVVGVLVLFLSICTAISVPLFVETAENANLLKTVVIVLGFNLAIGFPFRAFSGFLMADMRFDLISLIDAAKLLMRTFVTILFVSRGFGLVALAIITVVFDLLSYLTQLIFVLNRYRYLRLSVAFIDVSKIRELFRYSSQSFLISATNRLNFKVDNLVIGAIIGISSVALYSIAARLIAYFMEIMDRAIGMTLPIFSQYEASGEQEAIIDKFLFLTKISCYMSVCIGFFLIYFGKPLIQLWIGNQYSNAYGILLILVIPFILNIMQSPSIGLLYGISKQKYYGYINAVEGVSNLGLSLFLASKYGLYGVALGSAIPMFIIKVLFQPIYICRILGVNFWFYVRTSFLRVLITSLIIFNVYGVFVLKFEFLSFDLELVILLVVYFIFVLIVFLASFNKEEKSFLLDALKSTILELKSRSL